MAHLLTRTIRERGDVLRGRKAHRRRVRSVGSLEPLPSRNRIRPRRCAFPPRRAGSCQQACLTDGKGRQIVRYVRSGASALVVEPGSRKQAWFSREVTQTASHARCYVRSVDAIVSTAVYFLSSSRLLTRQRKPTPISAKTGVPDGDRCGLHCGFHQARALGIAVKVDEHDDQLHLTPTR